MNVKKLILILLAVALVGSPLVAQEAADPAQSPGYTQFLPNLILNGSVMYTVARGDSLMSIAEKFYGAEHVFYFPLILVASSDMLSHPDRLAPGMQIEVPDLSRNINEPFARENLRKALLAVAELYNNRGGRPVYTGLTQLAARLPSQYPEEEHHWSYTGDTGPEHWYKLDPSYSAAREGKKQSPINIITGTAAEKPVFHYTATAFEVENNGHTIEAIPAEGANFITLNGKDYALQQFHFHAPSEHQLDGAYFDMEVHLVHKAADENLAVVGFVINAGRENAALAELFAKLPVKQTEEGQAVHLNTPIDLSEFISGNETLYRYEGSLTTPPCTEGVQWTVSGEALQVSAGQLAAFRTLYAGNNRPVQALNDRPVTPVK
jgi:carbonic anhydrase